MRVPKLTSGASLALVVALAACGSNGDATRSPSSNLAAATAAPPPTATPVPATATATPTTTPEPTPTLAPLPSAQPMSQLWEAHGPVTDQTSTTYIAINPVDGNVWVGVPFESKFWIFSPDGKYLESWGEGGKGPGQFDFSDHAQNPDGWAAIAFAPDGSFYVGDTGNHRVQAFDARRQFVRQWGEFGSAEGKFNQIVSLATDGSTVYVGDGNNVNIQAFDADGTYLRTIGADGQYTAIAVGPDGRIYATNPQNPAGNPTALAILDPDGSEVSTTVLSPASVMAPQPAVDAAGNVFLNLEQNGFPWTAMGVVQLGADGKVVRVLEGGGDFVGVSPDGKTLYVSRGVQLDTTQWTFLRAFSLTE